MAGKRVTCAGRSARLARWLTRFLTTAAVLAWMWPAAAAPISDRQPDQTQSIGPGNWQVSLAPNYSRGNYGDPGRRRSEPHRPPRWQ